MDIKEFINARFLVPPIIGIFFVFLANPVEFVNFLSTEKHNNITSLILAPIIIFSVGFLISTLTTAFLVILLKLRRTLSDEFLNNIVGKNRPFDFFEKKDCFTDTEVELITWITILGKNNSYLQDQIHKRWHAFNASVNSIVTILVSWAIVIILKIQFFDKYPWFMVLTVFTISFVATIAFLITAINSYASVKNLDMLVVKRTIKEYKNKQKYGKRKE